MKFSNPITFVGPLVTRAFSFSLHVYVYLSIVFLNNEHLNFPEAIS